MILNLIRSYCSESLKFSSKYIFESAMSNISNKIEISFLCNGFLNYSKSILIVTNNNRYLINCGEGTQKLFIENGKKLNSLKNVFLTSRNSKNMSGLIGLALGMVECNNFDLTLHGFKESIDFLMLTKKAGEDKMGRIKFNKESTFRDSLLSVDKFVYGNIDCQESEVFAGYLFSSAKMRHKIDVEKCKNLGIPQSVIRSPKMAEFLKKPFVVIDENLTITSKDVLIEPPIPDRFIVMECPSLDYIPQMSDALPYKNFNNSDGCLKLVIHLTDKDVFNSASYKKFVRHINSHFDKDKLPLHVVVDSGCTIPLSFSSFYLQTCLNRLFDSEVFPKLQLYEDFMKNNIDRLPVTDINVESIVDGESVFNVVYSEPFMQFILNDKNSKPLSFATEIWSNLANLNEKSVFDKIMNENEGVPAEFMSKKMKELQFDLVEAKESLGDAITAENYPYVTFIGTSSATPSKYRNISCILIQAYGDTNVLFDCGEGSLDRIIMMHGIEQANEIIRNFRMICISHNHLDHHSGLYTLLKYRRTIGMCKSCLLVTTCNVKEFTEETDKIFKTDNCSYNCDWITIDLLQMEHNDYATDYPRTSLTNYENLLNLTLTPVRVFHTNTSYGFVLTGKKNGTNENWKITFSGDRTPKFPGLSKEGMNSDLLIHEATMDDSLKDMAEFKRHSTVSQAIEEGIKMKAKFTILTHFSSRYPLVPPVDEVHKNVAQAFDFLKINLETCKYLKVLDPYLEFIFPTHWAMLLTERQKAIRDSQNLKIKKRKIDV